MSNTERHEKPRKCRHALRVLVVVLLLGPEILFGQQTWPGDQGPSQNDQYNGQYAPEQQYGQQPETQTYQNSGQAYPQQNYGQAPTQAQPLNAAQLEQLVAPIALYPDALVAQVLAAATYPGQVAEAGHWRRTQGYASPDQIATGADVQNWDPSVKALTAFPQVLAQMERNLQWTTDLGNAYYNQPQDVLEAVQVMRLRAQAAGTLQSTPQQSVREYQGYIQLTPANPQVVYVPTYNPWTVYGDQVSPYPGYSLLGEVGSFLGSSPINYGLGIAMSAFSGTPWGWLAWGLNWLAQSVLFHQSNYYSHSDTVADWGFRPGLHAYGAREVNARHSYERTPGGYGRFGGRYGYGNRGQGFGRPPDRYAGSSQGYSNRGLRSVRGGYYDTSRPAYSYTPARESRQQFDRRGYGSDFDRRIGEGYRGSGATYGRSTYAYRAPSAYRTPSQGFQRGELERSSGALAGRDYARSAKPSHSGGFHLFGSRNAPKNVSSRSSGSVHMADGGHAPKSAYGGGKHSSGGALARWGRSLQQPRWWQASPLSLRMCGAGSTRRAAYVVPYRCPSHDATRLCVNESNSDQPSRISVTVGANSYTVSHGHKVRTSVPGRWLHFSVDRCEVLPRDWMRGLWRFNVR